MTLTRPAPRNDTGLHDHANHPPGHHRAGPENVRLRAQHNHTDRKEGRQRREKRADRAEEFGRVDLPTRGLIIRCMEGLGRRIDAEVKAYGSADHHDEEKGLGRQRRDA